MAKYINLRLILDKVADSTYRAQLEHESKSNPGPVEFKFALTDIIANNKDFRYYFDRISELKAKREDLEIVGLALYKRIFQGELGARFRAWYGDQNPDERFRLRLDIRAPELIAVPWELCRDDMQFLARRSVSIVRSISNAPKVELKLGPKLRVLIVSAAPKGNLSFDEDKYVQPVKTFFEGYNLKPDLLTGKDTTYQSLHERLINNKYDLFHFVGHGLYEEGIGKIVVVNNANQPDKVIGNDLADWVRESGVQFAFLCSCQTAETNREHPFRGVAQSLIGIGIPAVVAMQYDFPQDEAKTFVEAFYKRLLRSESIDEAMHYARSDLNYDRVAWCIPVLYSQCNVGTLVTKPLKPVSSLTSSPVSVLPSTSVQGKTQPMVFISYSEADETEKDALLTQLGVLQKAGLVNTWSGDQIKAGADWETEVEQAMKQAKVAILLITANFLNSDILDSQLPTLLERRRQEGLIVFPIIAQPCAWQKVDWLAKMAVRPRNKKPVWGDGGTHAAEDLAAIAGEVANIVNR